MAQQLWISRSAWEGAHYNLWSSEPTLYGDHYRYPGPGGSDESGGDIGLRLLDRVTGICLEPGEWKQVRMTIEEV